MSDDQDEIRDAAPEAPAIAPAVLERHPMPKEIADAVVAVMGELTKLAYTQENTYSNYRYAGVDDFYEAIRPLMAKAGLVIVPEEISTSSLTTQSQSGARSWLVIKYDFTLNVGGVEWGFRPKRTAMADATMGSQAFGAAASYAEKFFLRALFKVATGEPEVDGLAQPGTLPNSDRTNSRQAQGMGRDTARQQSASGAAQGRRQEPGTKTSAQAKRDGDWEALTKGMSIQRSEEELLAWAANHERDLAKLPRQWKLQVREQYVKELERVRANDERRARELDGADLNRPLDEQEDEDDGLGFGGDPLDPPNGEDPNAEFDRMSGRKG